ncbi:hypothetical protein [Delftia acidovorans]|uniref:hypothetical protein n=1 Tax=Delftia acidovorans TaxID=80866 RepID=UPI002FDEB3D0
MLYSGCFIVFIKYLKEKLMKIKALAASVCLSFSGLGLALADTQYTYVGVNYNDAHAPYTTSMSLSGSMVLPATLPASQTDIVIGPGTSYPISSWSFSDGVNTYTQANAQIMAGISIGDPPRFKVSTDGSGNITAWNLAMVSPAAPHVQGQPVDVFNIASGSGDIAGDHSDTTCVLLNGNVCSQVLAGGTGFTFSPAQGSWSMQPYIPPQPGPVAVPLLGWPALLALMGGVAGLAAWQRRREGVGS